MNKENEYSNAQSEMPSITHQKIFTHIMKEDSKYRLSRAAKVSDLMANVMYYHSNGGNSMTVNAESVALFIEYIHEDLVKVEKELFDLGSVKSLSDLTIT